MKLETEEIKKLAMLSRISLSPEETELFKNELSSIVGYISEINEVELETVVQVHTHTNILRDDIITNEPSQFTNSILENAPARKDNYFKVGQVL